MNLKLLLTKTLLVAAGLCAGVNGAWGVEITKTAVGSDDFSTTYLGDKSQAFELNTNGTWTFLFTNTNGGTSDAYKNFLLECTNGVRDEFVLRADNFETVRWANTDITSTYSGSTLANDLNGASINMTVNRNGYHITVSATITPSGKDAFTYLYHFYRASGNLTLYLSVEAAHLEITSAEWAAETGTITETQIVNQDFNDGTTTLFNNDSRITISNDNNVKFTNANNSTNGYTLASYDFSSLVGTDAVAVKVSFMYWIPNSDASNRRYFTLGQHDLRTGFAKQTFSDNGAMFSFGLARQSKANYFSINGALTTAAATAAGDAEKVLGNWASAEIMINLATKKVSYKIIGTKTYAGYDIAYENSSSDLKYCNQLDFFDCLNDGISYLDNLVITKYTDNTRYNYSVIAQNGSGTTLKELAYDFYTSGDPAITFAYPQCILSGTTLYKIGNNAEGDWFRTTFTPDANNYEKVLTYNNAAVENVVYSVW